MSGIVVALVGADGAGKSTVARRLPALLDRPVTTMYAGDNPAVDGGVLATTRLLDRRRRHAATPIVHGPPPLERPPRRAMLRRLASAPLSVLLLANQCAEEHARLRRAARIARSGDVAVLDRSYLHDYWHHDVAAADRSLRQRIHGWWLMHALPRADLVIVLDAPAEDLFARKAEGSVEALARRRAEYADLDDLAGATVVLDASRPLPEVEMAVATVIADRLRASGGAAAGG